MLVLVAMLLAACAAPTPQVIEKEVIVEKEVPVTVEVEKEKVVEKPVVQTVIVEKVVEKAEPEPVKGGWLTYAFWGTIQDTGDLHKTSSSMSAAFGGQVLDTLIRKNPADGSYNPGLATSWEFSPDNRCLTLKLRQDVKFHDGTPFNAQAVKFNMDRIVTLPEAKGLQAWTGISAGALYDKTEVVDDYTVMMCWKEPYARAIDGLTENYAGGINSPTAIQKYGDAYGTEAIVGTGPFKFVEWTGSLGELRLERNDEYNWASPIYKHQGPAYLDGFTVKGIVEAGTRRMALEGGTVDAAYLVPSDMAAFKDRPGFKVMLVPKRGTARTLLFNLARPILKDIRVRQAILHAIDREGLLQTPHFAGVESPAYAFLSEGAWGQSTDEFKPFNYLYDLEKAKALLEEVGWRDQDGDGIREAHGVEGVPDGTILELEEAVNANVLEESELLQGMLAKAGIRTKLIVNDFAAMMALCVAGNFDMSIQSMSGSHWFHFYRWFHSSHIGSSNTMGYSNPQVDALLDEASQTVDQEQLRKLFAQAMEIVLKEIPAAPIWSENLVQVMREEIMDITIDQSGVGMLVYDAWIKP